MLSPRGGFGGASTRDLCGISEKEGLGRHFGWADFHHAGRGSDDRFELVVR